MPAVMSVISRGAPYRQKKQHESQSELQEQIRVSGLLEINSGSLNIIYYRSILFVDVVTAAAAAAAIMSLAVLSDSRPQRQP